jgi:hypothetical protein
VIDVCTVCGDRSEADESSLGPQRGFCSNVCVGRRRSTLLDEIASRHGLGREQLDALLREVDDLPKFSRR